MKRPSRSEPVQLPEGFHSQTAMDPLTGNFLHTYRHSSGFTLKMLPRPGFSRCFAAITVPCGSIHTRFHDGQARQQVPAGTAHFLEHCVFSRDEQGGLLGRLSELGASANAYTTHTHTMYYFSTVTHFTEALDLYWQAIAGAYLEQDRVEAERPVILAELDQYQDDPDTRVYMRTVESLYAVHPVRYDIGGTRESVARINSDHLKSVWSRFYQPGMLTLTVTGGVDEQAVLDLVSQHLNEAGPPAPGLKWLMPEESQRPVSDSSSLQMDVAASSFLVGIKDPGRFTENRKGFDLFFQQQAARLALDCLLSSVSDLRENLYRTGLINDGFDYHYSCEDSYAFIICGGESPQPQQAADAVCEALIKAAGQGLDPRIFEIQKRAAAGDFVRSLDAIEHSGMIQARSVLYQIDLFDYPAIYDKITCDEAGQAIAFLQDPACYTRTVLQSLEK